MKPIASYAKIFYSYRETARRSIQDLSIFVAKTVEEVDAMNFQSHVTLVRSNLFSATGLHVFQLRTVDLCVPWVNEH